MIFADCRAAQTSAKDTEMSLNAKPGDQVPATAGTACNKANNSAAAKCTHQESTTNASSSQFASWKCISFQWQLGHLSWRALWVSTLIKCPPTHKHIFLLLKFNFHTTSTSKLSPSFHPLQLYISCGLITSSCVKHEYFALNLNSNRGKLSDKSNHKSR